MKLVFFYKAIFVVLIFVIAGCKKEHPSKAVSTSVIYYDTLITLQNLGPTVRLSFIPNTYIDIYFRSNIQESRCPNCLTLGEAQCPYKSWAFASFEVANQNGDSVALQGSFKSCYAENDTTPGTNNEATEFSPFNNTYNIWPIALNPYPTDTVSLHYSLSVLVQCPVKLQ